MEKTEKTWTRRIADARTRGCFTKEDKAAAGNWVTCACGKQDYRIPRVHYSNEPKDDLLNEYGVSFFHAVYDDEIDLAGEWLSLIDKRAGQILAKVIAKDGAQ